MVIRILHFIKQKDNTSVTIQWCKVHSLGQDWGHSEQNIFTGN